MKDAFRSLLADPIPAVAMTRPKRHLCIVGDSETVGRYVTPSVSASLCACSQRCTIITARTVVGRTRPSPLVEKRVAAVVQRMQVRDECVTMADFFPSNDHRGSKFLKSWMLFLEENADLRYPDLAELQEGG